MSVFSSIVCCVNLSENPDDLVQYVNDIVKQNDARLILVHVAPDRNEILRRTADKGEVETLIEDSMRKNEAAFLAYAKSHFVGEPVVELVEGKVSEEVLRVIDKHCADLVIIGSMSTKGLFGGLFNKSSEAIIGRTRVPVLVIPNDLSLDCMPDF